MTDHLDDGTRTIATGTHGRYLVRGAAGAGPHPLLVTFHGYGETAEQQLARIDGIDGIEGIERWVRVSIQGLHRFYRGRSGEIVAGWMTRQDRELAIADNLEYVDGVIAAVAREHPLSGTTVYAGFSQGVAMAFRCAARLARRAIGVIAVGGDVPPELDHETLTAIPSALIARGRTDTVYGEDAFAADERRLRDAGVEVRTVTTDAGHDWTGELNAACADFLEERV